MQFLQILTIKIINHQSEMHMYGENNSMVETLWKAKHVVSLSTVEVIPGKQISAFFNFSVHVHVYEYTCESKHWYMVLSPGSNSTAERLTKTDMSGSVKIYIILLTIPTLWGCLLVARY